MAKHNLIFHVGMAFIPLIFNACARLPIEFTVEDQITWSESDIKEMNQAIFDRLVSVITVNPGATIEPQECKNAFKIWLRKQFDWGLIPKKIIGPEEYAASSNNPLKKQCRPIDFGKDYEINAEAVMLERRPSAVIFTMEDIRKKIQEHKCAHTFVDPEKGKMELTGISVFVKTNALNIKSPGYTVFSSEKHYTKNAVEDMTQEAFIADANATKLADAPSIPAKFKGTLYADIVRDKKLYKKATRPLLSATGSVVAYPNLDDFVAETKEFEGNVYYIVPKGELLARVRLDFDFIVSLKDARCVYYDFLNQIKEDEKKRAESDKPTEE